MSEKGHARLRFNQPPDPDKFGGEDYMQPGMKAHTRLYKFLQHEHGGWGLPPLHYGLLFTLAVTRNAGIIVELGTGLGTSTTALVAAARWNGGIVWTVDQETPEQENNVYVRAILEEDFDEGYINFITGDSAETAKNWVHPKIDLLYQDARHSYEGVKEDLEAWHPHLKKDAIILIHDTLYDGKLEPPAIAGKQYAEKHDKNFLNIPYKAGIGVIY